MENQGEKYISLKDNPELRDIMKETLSADRARSRLALEDITSCISSRGENHRLQLKVLYMTALCTFAQVFQAAVIAIALWILL